jgi:hypothetical protein
MRIPPTGYLTLPCGELVRVIVWAHTGIFLVLVVGIAAGIGSVVAALGGLEEWVCSILDTLCGS